MRNNPCPIVNKPTVLLSISKNVFHQFTFPRIVLQGVKAKKILKLSYFTEFLTYSAMKPFMFLASLLRFPKYNKRCKMAQTTEKIKQITAQ